jgi:hypothetical protein
VDAARDAEFRVGVDVDEIGFVLVLVLLQAGGFTVRGFDFMALNLIKKEIRTLVLMKNKSKTDMASFFYC